MAKEPSAAEARDDDDAVTSTDREAEDFADVFADLGSEEAGDEQRDAADDADGKAQPGDGEGEGEAHDDATARGQGDSDDDEDGESDADDGDRKAAAEKTDDQDDSAASDDDDEEPKTLEQWRERALSAERRYDADHGRTAALQRENVNLRQENVTLRRQRQAPGSDGEPAPGKRGTDRSNDGGAELTKLFESKDWKDFQDELPEMAKGVGAAMNALVAQNQDILNQNQNLASRLDAVEGVHTADQIQANLAAVLDKHADYDAITGDPKFHEWLQAQPGYVLEMAKRNGDNIVEPDNVNDLLTRFKADTRGTQQPPNGKDDQADAGDGKAADVKPNGKSQLDVRRKRQLQSGKENKSQRSQGLSRQAVPDNFDDAFEELGKREVAQAARM